jgi:hypothetical protein
MRTPSPSRPAPAVRAIVKDKKIVIGVIDHRSNDRNRSFSSSAKR